MGFNGTNFENHIVILGWNEFAKELISILIPLRKIALIADNKEILDYIYLDDEDAEYLKLFSSAAVTAT